MNARFVIRVSSVSRLSANLIGYAAHPSIDSELDVIQSVFLEACKSPTQ
jgi:hypothetical protein